MNNGVAIESESILARSVPGMAAGLVSAVAVILISIPLRSPHDALLNSLTVGLAAILGTIVLGIAWGYLSLKPRAVLRFSVLLAAGLAAWIVVAVVLEEVNELERSISFLVPLASIQLGGTAALTPAISNKSVLSRSLAAVGLIAALGLAVALAGNGDQESGRLELPPRTTN